MSSSPPPKIAILGAGPAGLTVASLFTKNQIPYTMFDLRPRPSPNAVNQPSGSLDLHSESGLLALKACGLYSKFQQLEGECSEADKICDKTGTVVYEDEGNGLRPEIARNSLTELLLSSIPSEAIKWEHKVTSVSPASGQDGKWTLDISHEQQQQTQSGPYDLVIGADGAWSRIRPLLTTTTPHFSGMNCITLTIPSLSTTHPTLSALVGSGTFAACGPGQAVMAQRGSLSSARIYLMISSPSSTWLRDSGLETMSATELKSALVNEGGVYGTWGEQLKSLIAVGCDAEAAAGDQIDVRPLYMLPPGHTWEHKQGLTLVGDAAHLMTPFAGEGVNAAMLDALELSQGIIQAFSAATPEMKAMDSAVKAYEETMFPRAKEIMEETVRNMGMIFSEDAPKGFVEFMQSHGPPPEE